MHSRADYRCFLARIGTQYGIASIIPNFTRGKIDGPYTYVPFSGERDEIRLEVSKPAPGARERAYVCVLERQEEDGGKREKREKERGGRDCYGPIGIRQRELIYFTSRTQVSACARVRYTCMSLFPPLRVRLHPCVKFLRGILPSSSRPSPPTTSFLSPIYTWANRDQAAPPNSVWLVFGRSNFDGAVQQLARSSIPSSANAQGKF